MVYNLFEDFMIDGMWTAEFGSSTGGFGGGVVIIQGGKLMGGDGGYFYNGDFNVTNNAFQSKIEISPFIQDYPSVFNTVNQKFTLELTGSLINEHEMKGQGHTIELPDLQLGVRFVKRVQL
ncbi:MAG TPA: GrlR family regulatory protein [Candidatus Angelobacter sp.]